MWGCRFITTKHRDDFRRIVKTENYDLSIRYLMDIEIFQRTTLIIVRMLPFVGFSPLARLPMEDGLDYQDIEEQLEFY